MGRPLLCLFILLLIAPAAQAELVIEDEVRCVRDEMTVDGDVTVRAGGRLYLEDCTFKINTPPYANGWLNVGVEGSLLTVEEGGTLEVRSVSRNASLQPADPNYGYTLEVHGDLIMVGTEEHAVEVHGLEGYMAEAFMGGGITVFGPGTAVARNVSYHLIYGPALLALDGAHADLRDVGVFRASGAFGAVNASLIVHRAFANMGFEAVRVATSDLEVVDSELLAGRISVHATRSDVVVRDSTLAAKNIALRLSDSSAEVSGSTLRYGILGLMHEHKPERGVHANIAIVDSVFESFTPTGSSMAMTVDSANVTVQSTELRNYTEGGISMRRGAAVLDDVRFLGNGPFHAYVHSPPAIEADNNRVIGTANQSFLYLRDVRVEVLDGGAPVVGAEVDAMGETVWTDANGTVEFVWTLPATESGQPDLSPLDVVVRARGETRTVQILFDDEGPFVVDLDEPTGRLSPSLGAPLFLIVVAMAVLLRRC